MFDGLVVVATSIAAIDEVASRTHSLADEPAYQTALSARPDRLSRYSLPTSASFCASASKRD